MGAVQFGSRLLGERPAHVRTEVVLLASKH
jgi:hypothetical protein